MSIDESKALATAQELLDRARKNAPTLSRPLTPLAEQLRGAQTAIPAPARAPELYATTEEYARWLTEPTLLNGTLHNTHCQAGTIVIFELGEYDSRPCPHCRAQEREAELRRKLVASGIDGRYLDPDWEDLEQPAPLDRLARATQNITAILQAGDSLLIWSTETGSGKTQAAMLAAKATIRTGRTAQVVNIARLALSVRDGYKDKTGEALTEGAALQLMASPDLLVIDDLGAGETDNASVERRLLFLALDQRQMHRRSTIVTSNLPPKELVTLFGARILSRLQPLAIVHVDHGKNFRSPQGRQSLW